MAQQGWYPDPGGQTGMFRYWDGSAWSDVISPTPLPGPPSQYAAPQPIRPWGSYSTPSSPTVQASPQTGSTSIYLSSQDQAAYGSSPSAEPAAPKKRAKMWVTIGVGVVVLAVIAYFVVRVVSDAGLTNNGDPMGNPTAQVCPKQPSSNIRATHPDDGRVYGGALSYPTLADPWSPVDTQDTRIPFGRDVAEQDILIHENTDPRGDWQGWVISVMVGELYAGDGFYDPQQGSEIVNKCIFGTFYGNTKVTADTQMSQAFTLDGYDGWITVTDLSFSIPNLATTSELAIVIIVKTSAMSSSIFYASIPNDAMQYKPDIDAAIADLRVST
ncbi:MAG: DUF2510 domain-containing protein [Propionibacteriaceae bacterium]|nr:DUF2510 domain-containing protein [Propionibacteriaceae bacterium]